MRELFVVPCKFQRSWPVVLECVKSIRAHHPDADILVVDSDSDDRSYFPEVEKLGAQVADARNRHYPSGAYAHAVGTADFYYFIQDSLWLNAPIPTEWGTVRWFKTAWGLNADGTDLRLWGEKQLARIGMSCPDGYRGVFGPMWFCDRATVDHLAAVGFWDLLPDTKYEACAMERVTGIVLEQLGYDVMQSLQGEHVDHFGAYDESTVMKLNGARP